MPIVAGTRRSVTNRASRLRMVSRRRGTWNRIGIATLLMLSALGVGRAQNVDATKDATDTLLSVPPRSLIVDAAANELLALHHKGSYLRYRMETSNEKGQQVRDVIESKDGTVARLIMKGGRPLTPDEDKGSGRD